MYELRRAILELAANFVKSGKLESIDDIWMLKLEEIASSFDWDENKIKELVKSRQEQYARDSKFKPPAVLTSDGECVNKQPHNANIPEGALGGLPVSSGVVEGIAKVVLDPMTAVLNSGEILVCPCTDPGWTPLFINAAAVVMEVGGYLTHGSVVSREYGIPAVSCIETATTTIKTGMKLRVDGTLGFVQILEDN